MGLGISGTSEKNELKIPPTVLCNIGSVGSIGTIQNCQQVPEQAQKKTLEYGSGQQCNVLG